MSVSINCVMDAMVKYIDEMIIPNMNDWQEVAARIAIGRVINKRDDLKRYIVNTGYIRSFALIDDDGNVDIDQLVADLKREIDRKGKLSVDLKFLGKMRFDVKDVEKLHQMIMLEGAKYESH